MKYLTQTVTLAAGLCAASIAGAAPPPANLLVEVLHTAPVLRQVPARKDLWRDGVGKLWLKLAAPTARDSYWLQLGDLQAGSSTIRTLNIIGDHRTNPEVTYRTSSISVTLDCRQLAWRVNSGRTFDAAGRVQGELAGTGWRRIAVASLQEDWAALACG